MPKCGTGTREVVWHVKGCKVARAVGGWAGGVGQYWCIELRVKFTVRSTLPACWDSDRGRRPI